MSDDTSKEPQRVDPKAHAKQVQLALEEVKDAIEKAFNVASKDQVTLTLAHKYLHNTVDQINTLATLKWAAEMIAQQQQNPPQLGGEDWHNHG